MARYREDRFSCVMADYMQTTNHWSGTLLSTADRKFNKSCISPISEISNSEAEQQGKQSFSGDGSNKTAITDRVHKNKTLYKQL